LSGEVIDGEVVLSPYGEIVRAEWLASAGIRREVQLLEDEFVVMPNHVRGIVWIMQDEQESSSESGGQGTIGVNDERVGVTGRSLLRQIGLLKPGPAPRSLGSFVAGFKAAATREINQIRGTPGEPVWKRNYFDRVIRNEDEIQHLRQYMYENPLKWELDCENPNH
jgi:hypothetical protein